MQSSRAPERLLLECRRPPNRVNSVLAADPVPLRISPTMRPAMSFPARRAVLFVCFFRVRDDPPDEDDEEPELHLLVPLEVDEPLSPELQSRRLLFPRRLRSFRRCRFSLFRSFLRRSRALSFSLSAPVTSQSSTIFQTFCAKVLRPASPSAACPFSSGSNALHNLIVHLVASGTPPHAAGRQRRQDVPLDLVARAVAVPIIVSRAARRLRA